jgi:hypothetical protein
MSVTLVSSHVCVCIDSMCRCHSNRIFAEAIVNGINIPTTTVSFNLMGVLLLYRVIHTSVKYFKNSQQIDYATDHGKSYAYRERNSPSFFFKEKPLHIVCR